MDIGKYILRHGEIIREPDLFKWGRWMQLAEDDRIIEQTQVGDAKVSTVFLGLDYNFSEKGPPILFETMIFGGEHADYQDRCATLDEARKMHTRALWKVRGAPEEKTA